MYRISFVMSRYNILCFICDLCNVSYVMSGVGSIKISLLWERFYGDILWNDTININDAHIFLTSMLESQRQNSFQKNNNLIIIIILFAPLFYTDLVITESFLKQSTKKSIPGYLEKTNAKYN